MANSTLWTPTRLDDLTADAARLQAQILELVAEGAEFFDDVTSPLIEQRSDMIKQIKVATAEANVDRINDAKDQIFAGIWQLVDSTDLAGLTGEDVSRVAVERSDGPNSVQIIRINGKAANGKAANSNLRRRLATCFSECATDADKEMMKAALDAQKSGLKFNNREHSSRAQAENYVRDIVYVREHKEDRTVHQPNS